MANSKISELTAIATADDADVLVAISGGTTKKITRAILFKTVTDPTSAQDTATKNYVDTTVYPGTGWLAAGETWTRASATTFTISGDKTGKYQIGDKIKLTDTTTKYFNIVGVSYVDPNTTITVTGGTDYTLVGTLTSPFYSKFADPQGFPGSFAYTPTYTGFSGAVTTNLASFSIKGSICTIWLDFTGTSNTSALTASLPVNSIATRHEGWGSGMDNGSWVAGGCNTVFYAGTDAAVVTFYKAGNYASWTTSGTKAIRCTANYRIN